jgi:hypothetical protein
MRANRYDVTVLVNGLPMVHIELKRRGVDIREAFNQIDRYQRDSFWAGSGLFEYVQLFVISNGTLTKYYSNTVRDGHLAEQRSKRDRRKTANSFAFTSWWADAKNQPITELADFTRTFFAKHALLNILTRYCVFDVDRKLLVMRPYQIVAAERILQRINTATNHRQLGTLAAGGYHLAHHRQRQDADQLQGRATGARPAGDRQGAVRGGPQGSGLSDHARIRTLRERRGQFQHLDGGAATAAGRPQRTHHHHHHPEALPLRRQEPEAPCL